MMRHQLIKSFAAAVLGLFIGITCAFAQNGVTVSGKVVDESNLPMPGVGVMQVGTHNGVMTDQDGSYQISVPKGSVLEFSFMGYITQTWTAVQDKHDVKLLPDSQLLEETVVVGYGVQKKSDLTGSISQVKSEDLQNRTVTNATQALQGKTSGVQIISSSAAPGSTPSVRIRGISSNGSNSPLYVVDGRITSDISGIDPNDIESMEILKDGASAAIYGARAGNGVLLITTRRGQGDGQISYSYQLTAQSLNKIPKVMNSEEFIQYYLEDGRITMEDVYRNWDFKTNTDWLKESYETAIMQHHNLTFSWGNEKANLYVSGSYLDNNGMFKGDSDVYERITGMVNGSINVKPWLTIKTNNQIEHYRVRSVSSGSDYGSAIMGAIDLDPMTPVTYRPGELPAFMQNYLDSGYNLLKDENGNYYAASVFSTSENVNPLVQRDRNYSVSNGFVINGSTEINFKPIRDLVMTGRVGYRLNNSDSYGYGLNYYMNSLAHQNYISLNGSSGNSYYYQLEEFANWTHTFGKHLVNVMAGMSYSNSRSYSLSGSYQGSDDDLGVKVNDPLFYYFAYATSTATKSLSGAEPMYSRNLSYYGRASWSYGGGRYLLQASVRADAADLSVLPKDKRWGYFPAVSAGWTLSQENFYRNSKISSYVPYLKLRASWGQNGSTASLGGYMYANDIAQNGSYPINNDAFDANPSYIYGYAPATTGNDELKWETSEQLDFGLDARFLKDRLTFTMDWYKKTTKDLIVSGITPSTVVGVTASPVNAGNTENKGFEFDLGWKDHIGDFQYGISANLSTLKSKVTKLHESLSDGIDGVGVRNYGTITRFEKGYTPWHFYGYHFEGINEANGDPIFTDVDKNGVYSDADKMDLGSGVPDVIYGFTLNAAYKGLDLVVFGTGTAGSQIFNCLNVVDYTTNKLTEFTKDRWTPTHTKGAGHPAASSSYWTQFLTSDGVVYSGNFLKIKQIQLGYSLPHKLLQKVHVQSLRVYGSLDDFFTFTNYPGFDPEVTGSGSGLGVDKGSYPTSKKVVFGVNLTF